MTLELFDTEAEFCLDTSKAVGAQLERMREFIHEKQFGSKVFSP
jgi:hypothetical protein